MKNIYIKNKNFFYKKSYKKKSLYFIKNINNKKIIKKNIDMIKFRKKSFKKKILIFKKIKKTKKVKVKVKKKYNVKFCVFAGREKNLKILHSYIELLFINNIINEYHIFDFSRNNIDHSFIMLEYQRLSILFSNKIFLHNFNENEKILKEPRKKTDWSPFYKKIYKETRKNDIIIKCDDDILFIDIYSLKNAILDRINDKKSFLIHSNCINNGVCAYYQSNLFHKIIKNEINKYPKGGILGVLFEKPEIAYAMHNQFTFDLLNDINNLNKYIIDDVYINSRISINFILINGIDTQYFNDITFDDEYELSSLIPEKLCRYNKIKGDLITSHLSYSFQDKIILNRDNILNNYNKIKDKYISLTKTCIINYNKFTECLLKSHINNNIFTVKNWVNDNSFYIKNIETNKYLYIDYENDELILSNNKTIFEINKKSNKNIIEIKLGIYNLTRYNLIGKFRNENMLLKYFKDNNEKELLIEDIDDNNSFYIKFPKHNTYLSVNSKNIELIDINMHKINRWIFEEIINKEKYIDVIRYYKNKKFYYKNIDTNEIYTNYYLGWGLEGILW
jgi:hypothetical protein